MTAQLEQLHKAVQAIATLLEDDVTLYLTDKFQLPNTCKIESNNCRGELTQYYKNEKNKQLPHHHY